jgi:hypothetical protein
LCVQKVTTKRETKGKALSTRSNKMEGKQGSDSKAPPKVRKTTFVSGCRIVPF